MPCGNPDFLAKLVHCCEFDLIERESAEKGAREKASGFVEGLGSTFSLAGAASPERSSLELLFPGDETGKAVLTSLLQVGFMAHAFVMRLEWKECESGFSGAGLKLCSSWIGDGLYSRCPFLCLRLGALLELFKYGNPSMGVVLGRFGWRELFFGASWPLSSA